MLIYKVMMFFKESIARVSYTTKYLFSSKFYLAEEEAKRDSARKERNRNRLIQQLKNDEFRVGASYECIKEENEDNTIVFMKDRMNNGGYKRNVK